MKTSAPFTLAALQGRVLIKSASTVRNPFFQQAKQIGSMFQKGRAGGTNGASIIQEARSKTPMSMNDIALQKQQETLGKDQKKFQEEQAALAQQQQQFALQQQHEKQKLEIEKMLASKQAPSVNMLPQPEQASTHQAMTAWAKRLNKDLLRLTTRR